MNAGVMDNLQGKGKPLTSDQSMDAPWGVDAGQAALNRVLKTAGYKPASVEAKEAIGRSRRALENALALALARGATGAELTGTPKVGTSVIHAHWYCENKGFGLRCERHLCASHDSTSHL